MSNRGGSNGDTDWVPLAAGVAVSVGLLALLYKLFWSGGRAFGKTPFNQQQNAGYVCTCTKGGKDPVSLTFRPEELDKRRLKEAKKRKKANGYAQTDARPIIDFGWLFSGVGGLFASLGPWMPYFGGSALLLALLSLLGKNVDKIVDVFEMGSMAFDFDHGGPEPQKSAAIPTAPFSPEKKKQKCDCVCKINVKKIKWPKE